MPFEVINCPSLPFPATRNAAVFCNAQIHPNFRMARLQLQTVSFDELKPGSTVKVLLEQPPLIHAIDLAMVVTGEDSHDAARSIRRIKTHVLDLKSKMLLRSIKLPNGTKTIKFVTYEDALELVMALGGEPAKIMKTQFAKILTRFFAGDSTIQLRPVSFDELKPGSTVRVRMEQPPLIHAIDLAVVVTDKDANHAADMVRLISPDIFDQNLKIRYCFQTQALMFYQNLKVRYCSKPSVDPQLSL